MTVHMIGRYGKEPSAKVIFVFTLEIAYLACDIQKDRTGRVLCSTPVEEPMDTEAEYALIVDLIECTQGVCILLGAYDQVVLICLC